MKPIEHIKLYGKVKATAENMVDLKLNELIDAHNELLARYRQHQHAQDDETLDYGKVITGQPE